MLYQYLTNKTSVLCRRHKNGISVHHMIVKHFFKSNENVCVYGCQTTAMFCPIYITRMPTGIAVITVVIMYQQRKFTVRDKKGGDDALLEPFGTLLCSLFSWKLFLLFPGQTS